MIVSVNNNTKPNLEFLGTDYGGWAVDLKKINENSIVYSFGVGTDISFDYLLISRTKCQILAFDPTPRSKQWINTQNLNENFKFYDLGLSNIDGVSFFNEPPNVNWVSYSETLNPNEHSVECKVNKLSTIMNRFGHTHIDLLKMDIEGSEFGVLEDMFNESIFPDQVLVEFHGNNGDKIISLINKFSNYNIYKRHDRLDYYFIKK